MRTFYLRFRYIKIMSFQRNVSSNLQERILQFTNAGGLIKVYANSLHANSLYASQ